MALQQPKQQKGLNNFLKATILNADSAIYGTVCRYHTNEVGNMCLFGHSCQFLHFAHLDRPRLCAYNGSQQLSVEAQITLKAMKSEIVELRKEVMAIHSSLRHHQHSTVQPKHGDEDSVEELKASGDADSEKLQCHSASELNAHGTEAVSPSQDSTSDLKHDEKEPAQTKQAIVREADNEPVAGKPFEDTIEVNSKNLILDEIKQEFYGQEEENFDWINPGKAKQHSATLPPAQIDLFKFLWANSKQHLSQVLPTQALPDTYPEQLLCSDTDTDLPFENATLCKLKTTKYNGLPIIITAYDKGKNRYAVDIVNLSGDTNKGFTVKRDNIQLLEPTDISNAYEDFKEHLRGTNRTLFEKLETNPEDGNLWSEFVNFQLAPVPNRDEQLQFCYAWTDMRYFVSLDCDKANLYVTQESCQQIIYLLYHIAFLRTFPFVWKKYNIPTTWTWKEWPGGFEGMTHILCPPNN